MRDPDLVLRAQRAASALERAWERWRVMHGFGADPLPPVSSYVGYSLEEPWGQPRVVFGIGAEEAEKLAAILDGHDCVGPVHAEVSGLLSNGAAATPEWQRPDSRLNVPAQPTQPAMEQEQQFRVPRPEPAPDDARSASPIRSLRTGGRTASIDGGESAVRSDRPDVEADAGPAEGRRSARAGGQAGNGRRAGIAQRVGSGERAGDRQPASRTERSSASRLAASGELSSASQHASAGQQRIASEPTGSARLTDGDAELPPLTGLPPFPGDEPFGAEFAAAPVPVSADDDAVTAATVVADSPPAKPQRRKASRPGPLQVAKRTTRARRPAAAATAAATAAEAEQANDAITDQADQAVEPDTGPTR